MNNKIKELRKKKKLTQEELAQKINVTKLTISRWERGERLPKSDKAQELADFFNVSIGELLGFGTVEEEIEKSKKAMIPQWKKESDSLLNLGFVLSDNDLNVISQLLHNISDRNFAYFFSLVEHKDKFLTERLKSEFSAFYNKNPDFITNVQKDYTDHL